MFFIGLGNLTGDPEPFVTPNGKNGCKFTVAERDQFNKDKTIYYKVTAWGALADNCVRFLAKGKKVQVTSEDVKADAWINKADGKPRSQISVNARKIEFLSPASKGRSDDEEQSNAQDTDDMAGFSEIQSDDIPF